MTLLGNVAWGRDNNLNLIRAVAALAVLVSHAYPIALGPNTPEPLKAFTGFSLGSIAVFAFFIISGFLITQSFERSHTRIRFLMARLLRLWPALIVSNLTVALVLGPVVTTLPLADYLTHSETWSFILRNTTLLSLQFHLPGVYEGLPFTAVVGSIWTLLHEVLCYLGLFILGVAGLLGRKPAMATVFLASLALYVIIAITEPDLHPKLAKLLRLAPAFGVGVAFYVWRGRLPLAVWPIPLLTALTWLSGGTPLYDIVFMVTLGYTVFWLAYIPAGAIRVYNRMGDYSYGIYIYAFPLQGFAVWLAGPMTPLENMIWSLPMTLALAVLSWHLIEKPALAQRGRITAWLSPKVERPDEVIPDRRL